MGISKESDDIHRAIVTKAVCQYVALIDDKVLVPDKLFKRLLPYVDINHIPVLELFKNKRLMENIDLNSLDKGKLVRLMVKDISILDKIDTSKIDFTIKDILPILILHPKTIHSFNIDLNALTNAEVIKLLEYGNDYIDLIDGNYYIFSETDITEIVKKFGSNEKIMAKLFWGG